MRASALKRALAIAAVAASALAPAAQGKATATGLHNSRYCEVLELRGAVPDAEVTVWNTVGFSHCPAARWEALDPAALAAESGATAAILNGPRYFLMDSATGAAAAVRKWGGLKMRAVATIAIDSSSDLVQTTYTERAITRDNVWRWDGGRRVYELRAPDGARYVMQSYSLMRDPGLTIGDLRSLGDRLALPEGWSYRVRRLRRDLVLRAGGEAIVVQDELLNTYQRIK